MAISAADATTIATLLKDHAGPLTGATDTARLAQHLRDRRGLTGTDAAVIALYGEARHDPDLVDLAAKIRLGFGGIA